MKQPHPYRREIDACRPGSDDLQLPELAELAGAVVSDAQVAKDLEASHATDILLCEGLHEVPVPSGLAERMLAGLSVQSAVASEYDETQASAATVAAEDLLSARPDKKRVSRRAWLIAIPALAATLLAAVGIAYWGNSAPKSISEDQLASLAESWYQQAVSPKGWQRTVDQDTRERFPIDSVVNGQPVAQRTMLIQGSAAGVAYDLTPPGRQRAILLVIRTHDRYAVSSTSLAFTTVRSTGGKAIGAWQKGEYLYVLAVEGDRHRIHNFVRRPEVT